MFDLPPGFIPLEEEEDPNDIVAHPTITEDDEDYGGENSGYATVFDDPVGTWDNPLNRNTVGVSLPAADLKRQFGSVDRARGQMVEVINPQTGRSMRAPIVDHGPAPWVIERQGPTIDLTPAANRLLGGTGKTPMRWRFDGQAQTEEPQNYDLPPGFEPAEQAQAEQTGFELPEGFVAAEDNAPASGDLNIATNYDPKHLANGHPFREPESIKRIIFHGTEEKSQDALINYARESNLGYHYYVDKDGSITNVIPPERKANHTLGENSDSIGITLIGADDGRMPTDAQQVAANQLASQLAGKYGISNKNVFGHGELQPNRRHPLEAGHVPRDIRENGFLGAAPQQAQANFDLPEGFVAANEFPVPEKVGQTVKAAVDDTIPTDKPVGLADQLEYNQFQEDMKFPGDKELPRMSALNADRLGLKAWRDLESGIEVRRAEKPEVQAAEPVHGGSPSPTPLVPAGYKPVEEKPEPKHDLEWYAENRGSYTIELGQRGVKSVGTGVLDIAAGARQAEGYTGKELKEYATNPYSNMQDPVAFAKADLPRVEQELLAAKAKTAALRKGEYTGESVETPFQYGVGSRGQPSKQDNANLLQESLAEEGKLSRRLMWAKAAANGNLDPDFVADKLADKMISEGKESVPIVEKRIKQWNELWAPVIDKSLDRDPGVEFVESVGQSAPSMVASAIPIVGPAVGLGAMQFQNFHAAKKDITDSLQKAGKPIDEQAVDAQAWRIATDQTALEIPGGVGMGKVIRGAMGRVGSRIMGKTAAEQGKIWNEIVVPAVKETFSEAVITSPGQEFVEQQAGEKAGYKAPLSREEAEKKYVAAGVAGGLQSVVVGGAGTVVSKIADIPKPPDFAERLQEQAEKISKGPQRAGTKPAETAEPAEKPVTTSAEITAAAQTQIDNLTAKRDGVKAAPTGKDSEGNFVYAEADTAGRPLLKHEEEQLAFLEKNINNPEALAQEVGYTLEKPAPAAATATTTAATAPTNANNYLLSQGHTQAQIDALKISELHKLLNAAPGIPAGIKVNAVNANTGEILYTGGIGTSPVLPAAGMTVNNAFSPGGRQQGTITAVNPDGTVMVSWEGKAPVKLKGGGKLRLPPGTATTAPVTAATPQSAEKAEAATAKPASKASVPVMITKQMESDLKTAGYTQEQINKMTPIQAHVNLGGNVAGVTATKVTTPAGATVTKATVEAEQPTSDEQLQKLKKQFDVQYATAPAKSVGVVRTASTAGTKGDTQTRDNLKATYPEASKEIDEAFETAKSKPDTDQRATVWQKIFKTLAPGPSKKLTLEIKTRSEAAEHMNKVESSIIGEPSNIKTPGERTQAAVHRNTVYLFQEALDDYKRGGKERSEGVKRVQHEIAHTWYDALSPREKQSANNLWKAETQAKAGPLYDDNGNLEDGVMEGVETDVREWFAERVSKSNDDWAQKKVSVGDHNGTPVGKAAAALRKWLFSAQQTIAPQLSRDVVADEFRKVLKKGVKTPPTPKVNQKKAEATKQAEKPIVTVASLDAETGQLEDIEIEANTGDLRNLKVAEKLLEKVIDCLNT